jgi:hypothetical protein
MQQACVSALQSSSCLLNLAFEPPGPSQRIRRPVLYFQIAQDECVQTGSCDITHGRSCSHDLCLARTSRAAKQFLGSEAEGWSLPISDYTRVSSRSSRLEALQILIRSCQTSRGLANYGLELVS